MKLFSSEFRQRIVSLIQRAIPTSLHTVSSYSSWNWPGRILEPFTGAWQKNVVLDTQPALLAFSALYACVTGIASDIAVMRIKLDTTKGGIWEEIEEAHGNSQVAAILPLLKKPNHYQNCAQFLRHWIISKLLSGNTYILKERETSDRKVIRALYVLDPLRVKVLVAEDSSVYYELQTDYLSGVDEIVTVPASEIIHDRMPELWYPLVGISPIYACATSVTMGNRIQSSATTFYGNAARPSGILTAPGMITDAAAASIKARFQEGYSGANAGKIAVVGDDLKFTPMTLTAEASQTLQQLQFTVSDVGRAFHYPDWKLNTGSFPPYSSGPEALTMMYYKDCLQPLIQCVEDCLDEGLALPVGINTELDLDSLLRMDTKALFESNNLMVGGGWGSPNEARFRANLKPVPGGNSPMIQEQNYSLAAIDKRDAMPDPFAHKNPAPQPALAEPPPPPQKTLKGVMADEDIRALTRFDLAKEFEFIGS